MPTPLSSLSTLLLKNNSWFLMLTRSGIVWTSIIAVAYDTTAVDIFAIFVTTATVLDCTENAHKLIKWVAPQRQINAPNWISTHRYGEESRFLDKLYKFHRNEEIGKCNKKVCNILKIQAAHWGSTQSQEIITWQKIREKQRIPSYQQPFHCVWQSTNTWLTYSRMNDNFHFPFLTWKAFYLPFFFGLLSFAALFLKQ